MIEIVNDNQKATFRGTPVLVRQIINDVDDLLRMKQRER